MAPELEALDALERWFLFFSFFDSGPEPVPAGPSCVETADSAVASYSVAAAGIASAFEGTAFAGSFAKKPASD